VPFRITIACLAALTLPVFAYGDAIEEESAVQDAPSAAPATPTADSSTNADGVKWERWNLYFQATSIGDYHGAFPAKYSGSLSLVNHSERDVSLTSTLYLGFRVAKDTLLYFNPEIAGGRGFSNVDGLANATNGELPRVASATPKPYVARLYIQQDFAIGPGREKVMDDANQLGGTRPETRYTIVAGRFTVTDFFDNNVYSHDPRSQFMGWGVMYNGAWDYPADTRGYNWGWMHELHTKNWSVRYASVAEPKVANGLRFDRRLLRDRGDMVEGELDYAPHAHPGAVRVMPFWLHTDSGSYAESLALAASTHTTPDITATREVGRLKYGVAINMDQEIAKGIGVFARLGWNDGKTESFAFTAIDRLATGGVSFQGTRWHRPKDVVATEVTVVGLSGVHRAYLAAGGLDFLIGDGSLNYAPETIWESYYNAHVFGGFYAGLDAQHVNNPAYNQDRGPLWIYSLRLHLELGKDDFVRKH